MELEMGGISLKNLPIFRNLVFITYSLVRGYKKKNLQIFWINKDWKLAGEIYRMETPILEIK